MRRGRGFSLVEVLIVAALLAALGLPVLGLISTGTREGALSEDFMFAEALASRLIEEWAAQPFGKLDDMVPRRMVSGQPPASGAPPGPPYHQALSAPAGFTAELEMSRVQTGLLSLEVSVTWQVSTERSPRRFALYLLKSDPEISLEAGWKL